MTDTNRYYEDLAGIADTLRGISLNLGTMIGELARNEAATYHIVHFCKIFLGVNKVIEEIEAPL
jgi:hypothetical protein